jgi:hypothetical protein
MDEPRLAASRAQSKIFAQKQDERLKVSTPVIFSRPLMHAAWRC